MPNKMLIDASHPEETRVVVLRGNRVEEFDFESASKKQLRGNIYLAKVTRVEPSLQAAFVEYGGNRHGFLAFSEIHPDYYQIPVADRQALLEEEARIHSQDDDDERPASRSRRGKGRSDQVASARRRDKAHDSISEAVSAASGPIEDDLTSVGAAHASEFESLGDKPHGEPLTKAHGAEADEDVAAAAVEATEAVFAEEAAPGESEVQKPQRHSRRRRDRNDHREALRSDEGERDQVEQMGGDAMEELPHRVPRYRKQYKIQEVIKRRQVLLVQVVKEERGNKGAALTTYLSLAGRYSVLMPNTARGGGISRKITDAADRKRLKAVAQELEVPDGMGVILRTAGAARTKAEIKRDFEYLLRVWETVRELTLRSSAPTLVYEEGSLIKRSIRDLYNKDIDEVIVAGEEAYREAKDFMRMLMPSHAKNVKQYKEPQPIFAKAGAEAQLDAMFSNHVTLRSGGYIVINQTEALVAIDVNSGRSTREHNIEDTALRTNLEASDEVARQLRLRDLAGLIVVDFIDMEETRNNRAVERRMKDALSNDRARIQVGRISHFGLLEMSRQRMRTGVLEGSTIPCPHCAGAGSVRSTASIALHILRILEDALIRNAAHHLIVRTRTQVALYILNQKRTHLRELESRFGVSVTVAADETLGALATHALERGEAVQAIGELAQPELVRVDSVKPIDVDDEPVEEAFAIPPPVSQPQQNDRSRPARPERNKHQERPHRARDERPDAAPTEEGVVQQEQAGEAEDLETGRRRRRRRRRKSNGERETALMGEKAGELANEVVATPMADEIGSVEEIATTQIRAKPYHVESRDIEMPAAHEPFSVEAQSDDEFDVRQEQASRRSEPLPEAPAGPKRGGWWQRAKATITGSN